MTFLFHTGRDGLALFIVNQTSLLYKDGEKMEY